ncbi:hypothetical protein BGZ65_001995 [Modicella reniformis]|uniref:F-box domain-containing protein n=1 Tax=Modicella reniformis TaxID=1440133 RepID=A0A9P6M9T5_9FUNG|nr:hypothetical protein BGZ65_001995 [Modicella reniformis]
MLGLPEIDEKIYKKLSHHDLAQCARVCKKWHRRAIPYLWHQLDIPFLNHGVFHKMILEDYLYEQLHPRSEGENFKQAVEPHIQERPSPLPLAKYGHWIRQLPQPCGLLNYFESPFNCFIRSQEAPTGQVKEPTASQLLRHIYKRCPNLQVYFLYVTEYYPFEDISKTIAEFLLPTVRILSMYISDPWYLKYLLDHCTDTLAELSLWVDIPHDAAWNDKEDQQLQDESRTLGSLKKLILEKAYDDSVSKSFWPWLYKRCRYVERLEVLHVQDIQSLADSMLTYMPNLSEIRFGDQDYNLNDKDISMLLSGSRQGWKVVEFEQTMMLILWKVAQEALTKHFPTLEKLILDDHHDYRGYDFTPILLSSPNLYSLTVFAIDHLSLCSPKTWPYATTLRVLKIKIVNIPRPDLKDYEIVQETYSGEGRQIQLQVYDRLARLTNLETLWLGNPNRRNQKDCLEMSLESGMHKLAGLKSLKELQVTGMKTRIGLEEVQWMTENWPKIRTIMFDDGNDAPDKLEAVAWLHEHHPQIKLDASALVMLKESRK